MTSFILLVMLEFCNSLIYVSAEGEYTRNSLQCERLEALMSRANVNIPQKAIAEFCKKNHIRSLALFVSVLSDNFRSDSDVDVLVEFEPGHVPGFFRLFDLEEELSFFLGGRKVDLRTPQDLSRYFRDEVIAHAEVHYAKD